MGRPTAIGRLAPGLGDHVDLARHQQGLWLELVGRLAAMAPRYAHRDRPAQRDQDARQGQQDQAHRHQGKDDFDWETQEQFLAHRTPHQLPFKFDSCPLALPQASTLPVHCYNNLTERKTRCWLMLPL
jgi:hypothetical protein